MCGDYRCRECGKYFDKPRQYTDWVEFWGANVPMYSYTCPHCDSSDFDEADVVEQEEIQIMEVSE